MKKSRLLLLLAILSLISIQTQSSFLNPVGTDYQLGKALSNPGVTAEVQQIPDVLRMGDLNLYDLPIDLDPLNRAWVGPHSIMYEPLIEYNAEKNIVVPVLAYQWVVTNDSKHWTFDLRDNILFHDGSAFNAQAVKISFERAHIKAKGPAPYSYAAMPLESVEIVNEFQIIFHFYESYSPFIHREAQTFFVLSPNSFEGENLTSPIGTGPYKISLEQSNSTFLHYNRFDLYHSGVAPFKEIHYTIYPQAEGDRFDEDINEHKIDYAAMGVYIDSSADPYWNTSYTEGAPVSNVFHFNISNPYLADKNVRKALNYAIDKKTYVDGSPSSHPLRSLLPPGYLDHDPTIEGYLYNPELANTLLDEAGFTRGEDNVRFSLRIIGADFWEGILNFVATSLEQIGIRCEVEPIEGENFLTRWEQGDYDLALFVTLDYDSSIIYSLLHTNGAYNTGGFENETINYLTTLAQETPVRQERKYYYKLVQEEAQEECPYLLMEYYPMHYFRAQHLTPYFHLSGKARLIFNCTNGDSQLMINSLNFKIDNKKPTDLKLLTDITVADQAIYFPITDAIIANPNVQPLEVTMKMSHQLSSFLPTQNATGKFYQIETDNEDLSYRFRSYYDPEELEKKSYDQLALFEYDETQEIWRELVTLSSNTSLSYVEIELKGGKRLLRLDESIEELVQLTYKLFPFISIFTIPMIVIIVLTIAKNQKVAKYVKNKY
ncbi:MAG: ABC transporter substrate-binding protein [Candidatus Heimdallarchaeota archaeon]|nr:MAG: ABC transporter substrate-binding protein [Candidatus Heimdallarchaeota archaeon]